MPKKLLSSFIYDMRWGISKHEWNCEIVFKTKAILDNLVVDWFCKEVVNTISTSVQISTCEYNCHVAWYRLVGSKYRNLFPISYCKLNLIESRSIVYLTKDCISIGSHSIDKKRWLSYKNNRCSYIRSFSYLVMMITGCLPNDCTRKR